jgi:hypothetical protein
MIVELFVDILRYFNIFFIEGYGLYGFIVYGILYHNFSKKTDHLIRIRLKISYFPD